MAFHEEGRSESSRFVLFFVGHVVSSKPQPPLSPPFHPHSVMSDFDFARCQLGVLVSVGAAT